MGYGELMLRAPPQLCLGLVATRASLAPDKCRIGAGARRRGLSVEFPRAELKNETDHKHGNCCRRQRGQRRSRRESISVSDGRRWGFRTSRGLGTGSALLRRRFSSFARQRRSFSVKIVNIDNIERSVLSERD